MSSRRGGLHGMQNFKDQRVCVIQTLGERIQQTSGGLDGLHLSVVAVNRPKWIQSFCKKAKCE